MKFTPKTAELATLKTDLIAGLVFENKGLEGLLAKLDRSLEGFLSDLLKREEFRGKKGETKLIHLPKGGPARAVFLYGAGRQSGPALRPSLSDAIRKMSARAVKIANKNRSQTVSLQIPTGTVQAAAEGVLLGSYSFDLYKSEKKSPKPVQEIELLLEKPSRSAEAEMAKGTVIGEATNQARDWVNIPACDMTPLRMADEATKVGQLPGLSVRIYQKKEIEKMGMGSFLAVASGSKEPPCLIHLTYKPTAKAKKRIALVGKGVTFDSGGLSLKTAQSMETMKDDMSGAAAVVSVMKALSVLKPAVEVHGIAAMTENMPSGSADKPGDIARAMTGKTIEILNTDAEGRLTLADAIPFALKQKPDLVIDIATLTGACVVALGELCAGILGNDQPLIDRIIKAGRATGERIWQLPMIEEYKEDLKSTVADVKNIGGRWGGTINGALFIEEFVDSKVPWAHVDIAGPSWTEKELDDCPRGGTGFMVRTLIEFIGNI